MLHNVMMNSSSTSHVHLRGRDIARLCGYPDRPFGVVSVACAFTAVLGVSTSRQACLDEQYILLVKLDIDQSTIDWTVHTIKKNYYRCELWLQGLHWDTVCILEMHVQYVVCAPKSHMGLTSFPL
jgi:hypothetical protein